MNTNTKIYFHLLQVYRGIAAFMVVYHHTYISFDHYHGIGIPFLKYLADVSKFGVDFFFVLSGFIIAYTTYNHRDNIKYLKKYYINRLARIYIPFLPISILMLSLYFVFPGVSNGERNISVLTSLTLLPHGTPALGIAWTLTFEILFYILYSLNFIRKNFWYIFMFIWAGLVVAFLSIGDNFNGAFLKLFLSPYILEFLFGVVTAYFLMKYKSSNKYLVIILSLLSINTSVNI